MISGLGLFPSGATGAGLLLLRISLATSLLTLTSVLHSNGSNALQFLGVVAAIGLCVGFRTRIIGGLSLAVPIFGLATGAGFAGLPTLHAIDALALVLAGPGALSADAISFGRRTVILPERNDTEM